MFAPEPIPGSNWIRAMLKVHTEPIRSRKWFDPTDTDKNINVCVQPSYR